MGLQPHVGPEGGPHRLGVWGRNAGPRPKRGRDASALLVVGLEMWGLRPLRGAGDCPVTAGGRRVQGLWPAGASSPMSQVRKHRRQGSPACGLEVLVALADTGVSLSLWKHPESKADWDPLPKSLGCCVSVVTTTLPHLSPGPRSRRMGSQGQSRTCTGLGWPRHGRLVPGQSSGARLGSCGCQECPP